MSARKNGKHSLQTNSHFPVHLMIATSRKTVMNSGSELKRKREYKNHETYGAELVKNEAFSAIRALLELRLEQGKSQKEIAASIGKDEGWLSRNLAGPANWTFKTFGVLVQALDGCAEVKVIPSEDIIKSCNFDIYESIGIFTQSPPKVEKQSDNSHSSRGLKKILSEGLINQEHAPKTVTLHRISITSW